MTIPVEQLHLLPSFSRVGNDGITVPYSLLVHGFPPVQLCHWTMADFCRDAVVQLDRRPSHVQFLTVPLPGLDSPQVIVAEPGQAELGALLPLDLRAARLEVMPLHVEAGMSVRDILDRAAESQPALHEAIIEPWSQDRVFLQDCRGRVHDVLPAEIEDMQWLALRIQPARMRAPLSAEAQSVPDDDPASTTTSTTLMRAPGPTASLVIVCDGATVRSAQYPLENAPLRLILIDLLRSLVSLGRLRGPFTLQLAPVMARSTIADHLIVPFLARTQPAGVEVFIDPGSDALQLHSLAAAEGFHIGDALSPAQRQAGMRAFINGVPEELCRRPLRTGDYVVTHSGDTPAFVVRNLGPALDRIEELRLFSLPISFPALGLISTTTPATLLARPRNQPFGATLERALLERTARMGTPSRTWSSVWLLEPARAPHRLWIDIPTAPGPRQAAELIEETGLLLAGSVLSDADSDAEMAASAMFLVTSPEDSYETYTVSDPVTPLGYHLMHLTPGITVSLINLPVRPGMRYRPPRHIQAGAHFALVHDRGEGAVSISVPPLPPPHAPQAHIIEDTDATDVELIAATQASVEVSSSASDAPPSPRLSEGTSLAQIKPPPRVDAPAT